MVVGTLEETLEHALFLAKYFRKNDLQSVTIAILFELGIDTDILGFEYLKRAIMLYCTTPGQMVMNEIYPGVGKMFEAKPNRHQVEQTIRTAITKAWKNRDDRIWRIFFLPDKNGAIQKPSNGEFISRIAYFLQLWQGCCREEVKNEK